MGFKMPHNRFYKRRLTSKMSNTYIPERAMFIFAHPDDIEFGSAGTAAKWARHGAEVIYVVLTDGNIGSHEAGMTAEKLAEIRRREQTAAAETVGASCIFFGEPDGYPRLYGDGARQLECLLEGQLRRRHLGHQAGLARRTNVDHFSG